MIVETNIWSQVLFQIGSSPVSVGQVAIFVSVLLICAVGLNLILVLRAGRQRREHSAKLLDQAREQDARIAQLLSSQSELTGRLGAVSEAVASHHTSLATQLNDRLDGMSGRIGQSLTETGKSTQETLGKLQERLAVIDSAQSNIMDLTGQVGELQSILSNKQTRGAFGQSRMEMIVRDGLPMGGFEFQPTLSNGKRPDCIVFMPNGAPSLVIDSKFPLEGWTRLREAQTEKFQKAEASQFRRDMDVHIKDISGKYLIPGETQDTAFLFVPSESIFSEIHEHFDDIIQKAQRARVVIVSPSLLMLSIQVVQALLKDARMREQAHLIQAEIGKLLEDVARLDDRVGRLAAHFTSAQKDIEQIAISSSKVVRRGERIVDMDVKPSPEQTESDATPSLRAISSR
ncbi:MAG: DNA recombination protein RmuC [Pseudomonadota bacterium]